MISSIKKLICLLACCFLSVSCLFGQKDISSLSLGNLYVPAEGSIGIFNDHNFAEAGNGLLPGILATDRSENRGKIFFSGNASWSNADDYSHIDGYVGVYKNEAFLLPTGDNSVYAPIGLSNPKFVEAAYFAVNPSVAVTSKILSYDYTDMPKEGPFDIELMNSALESVSDKEYWFIDGKNETHITLTWNNHSDIGDLVDSDLKRLTIVGWDGTQWIDIPSSFDKNSVDIHSSQMNFGSQSSNFNQGSITSDEPIVPDAFSILSFGRLKYDKSEENNRITVFPNPVFAGTHLNVSYKLAKSNEGVIKLFNANNQLIFSRDLSEQKSRIDIPLSEFGRGVFNIAITNKEGKTTYQKLIVVDR